MTTIYALFDDVGKMRRCSDTIDGAANYGATDMGSEFWNALFSAATDERIKVFHRYGWKVLKGSFQADADGVDLPDGGKAK